MTSDQGLRPVVTLMAVVVAAVAAALFMLPRGGSESAAGGRTELSGQAAHQSSVDVAAAQPAPARVVESYEVFGGKNPFQRPPAGPMAPTSTTTPGGAGTSPTSSTVPGGGGSSSTTTIAPGEDPIRGTTIALIDVFAQGDEKKATVRVNGRVYVMSEGDTVEGHLTLVTVDLGRRCADFLYDGRAFELCVGQEIIK